MIGKWLLRMIRKADNEESRNHPQQSLGIGPRGLMDSPVVSVYRITNGYILASSQPQRHESTLVYCKELNEIGDQIITLQAREAMGIPNTVNISALGGGAGGGSTLAAYPVGSPSLKYPRS